MYILEYFWEIRSEIHILIAISNEPFKPETVVEFQT